MNSTATVALAMSIACMLPAGAAAQATAAPTLEGLAFMAGCWRSEFGGGSELEEFYTNPVDNLMLGLSRFLRDGRATEHEFSRITFDSTGIVLLPFPGGKPSEHEFRLTSLADGRALFEAPEHDFPKRIRYTREPDGSLTARIDAGSDDSHAREWRMQPVACPESGGTG
jgi:hypothetical protein